MLCGLVQNALPKTIVVVLSVVLILCGVVSTGLGIYTYAKHQDDSFFDAYMRDEFMSNATRTYIWALRINTTTAEDLETVFDFFSDEFDKVLSETIVKNAWKPRDSDLSNLELSLFLQGFRASAQCTSDCSRGNQTSADFIANWVNENDGALGEIGNLVDNVASIGGKIDDLVDDAPNPLERRLARRLGASTKPSGSAARRRTPSTMFDATNAPLATQALAEDEREQYNAGYDLAQLIKDFAVNWIVLVVFGVSLLVMGGLAGKALTKRWVALLLAVCCLFMGFFLICQYGQSQGWNWAEDMLSHINFGGVVMDASDELKKNDTADLAINALMGFYKPYYLLIGGAVTWILGTAFLKLAFCSNMKSSGVAI